jgi:hypothetical protein
MSKHADKISQPNNKIAAAGVGDKQKSASGTFQLKDNRPEATELKQIEGSANNSLQVKQLMTVQKIADKSTGITKQLKQAGKNNMQGVIQLHLADDLNGKKINVAIAGETHDEIPVDEEMEAWRKAGIKIHYEADKIPLDNSGQKTVTPDPVKLRLAFGFAKLNEHITPFLEKTFKPGKVVDSSGTKDAAWVLKYVLPILVGELEQAPKEKASVVKPLIGAIEELRSLLSNNALVKVQGDELERLVLASTLRRTLKLVGDFIGEVHADSVFKDVPFKSLPLRVARSQQMLDRINKASGSLEKIIYKVGNLHVTDMRTERWEPAAKVGVYERSEYIKEYTTIPQKKIVPTIVKDAPKIVTPIQLPKNPSVSVVVKDTQKTVTPLQPPKSPSVSTVVKEVPKGSVPIQPPKNQSVSSIVKQEPKIIVPFQPPKKETVSPVPTKEPVKTKKIVKPREPVQKEKTADDIKVEKIQALLNNAPEGTKTAKGFLEIQGMMDHYFTGRMGSANILVYVKNIIDERNNRSEFVKWAVRSKETQQLYDDISNSL